MAVSTDPSDPNFGLEMDPANPNFGLTEDIPSTEPQVIDPEEYDQLYYKTGKTKRERELARAEFQRAMEVPALSPERATSVFEALGSIGATRPEDLHDPVMEGVNEELGAALSGMTSTAGAASFPEYLFPATAAIHAGEAIEQIPQQIQDVVDSAEGGTPKEVAANTTKALLNILMTSGIIHGGAKGSLGPKYEPYIKQRPPMETLIRQQKASRLPPPVPDVYANRQFTMPQEGGQWLMGPDGRHVPWMPDTPQIAPVPPLLETLKGIGPTPGVREVPQSRALAIREPNFVMRPEARPELEPAPGMEATLEKAQPPPVDPTLDTHAQTRAILDRRQAIINEIERIRPMVMKAREVIGPAGEQALEAQWKDLNDQLNNRATNPVVHAPPPQPRTGVVSETARLPGAGVEANMPPMEVPPAPEPSSPVRTNIPSETARVSRKAPPPEIDPADAKYAGLPEQKPTPATTGETPGVGARNETLRAREEAGLSQAPPPGIGTTWHESVKNGHRLLDAGWDPYQVLADFKANKKLGRDEMDVARAHLERLQLANSEAHGTLELDPKNADLAAEAARTQAMEDAYAAGYQPMKTEWARIGHGLQEERGITDADLLSQKKAEQAMRDALNKELTDADKARAAKAVRDTRQANVQSENGFKEAVNHAEKSAKGPAMTVEQMKEHFAKRIKELTPCDL